MSISENYQKIREEVPDHVCIVLAAKTRSKDEVLEAINAGATDIGENYVQEAEDLFEKLGNDAKKVRWHLIGHLQSNKVNKVSMFDVIQTIDSFELAKKLNNKAEKLIPIYIQVNIGEEENKSGIKPGEVKDFILSLSSFSNLKVEGLMTIEPVFDDPEEARPYFKKMRKLFDEVKSLVDLKILSMGMSNAYKVAIEEGSNMIRLGTIVFGERVLVHAFRKMELTEKEQKAREMLCLPLDGLTTLGDVRERVDELSPFVGFFKIGKETFTRFGPSVVKLVQDNGSKVFLDLKYHDIPNTVKGAADAASQLGVYMFNVHASGGLKMMRAAVEGARKGAERYGVEIPKVIAVTILTSIDKDILNDQLRIFDSVGDYVLHLAQLANSAGFDGIVCSAEDLHEVRDNLPKDFIYVTPGIKGPRTSAGVDQKRVLTPGKAVQEGSSILIVGRAITDLRTSERRIQACYEILQDIAKYL